MKKIYDPAEAAGLFPEDGWNKSTFSDPSGVGCVQINRDAIPIHGVLGLRDSKQPEAATLVFDQQEWTAFLSGAQSGEFDWPA